jgi:hypothetical protein
MRLAVRALLARFGERRDVTPVRFDASTAVAVHRTVIRVSHDHVVPHLLKMLRDPFALSRGFDEYPHPRPTPEDVSESLARRRDAVVDNLTARRDDPNLTFLLVKVDGTIFHGWSPLVRLERVFAMWSGKLPPHEGDQPLHPICGKLFCSFPTSGGRVLFASTARAASTGGLTD